VRRERLCAVASRTRPIFGVPCKAVVGLRARDGHFQDRAETEGAREVAGPCSSARTHPPDARHRASRPRREKAARV